MIFRAGPIGSRIRRLTNGIKIVADGDSNAAVTLSYMRTLQARFEESGYSGVSLPDADVLAVSGHKWSHAQERVPTAVSKAISGAFNVYLINMGTNNFSPPAGFNQTISQAIAEAAACIAAVESTGVFQHVAIMEIADHETLTATVNEYNQQLHQFKSPRRSIIRRPSVWDDALNDTYFLNESPYSIHFNQGTTRDAARDAIIAQLVRDL